jgi:dihydroorotase
MGKTQKTVSIHCEDETIIDKTSKPKTLKEHLKSRPNECEISAIKRIIPLAELASIHICHVSTAEGAKLTENANVTSEVTPHHLFLNNDSELSALGKVNPPLREKKDQEALWMALHEGKIEILASDHAPHTIEEKEQFEYAPSGVPGVETMLPMMLSMVKHNKFNLTRLVNAICEKPAEIFHLKKGKLEVGYDADILAVDMRKETEIKDKNLHSKCGWTPFEGFSAVFPRFTFLRGEVVIEDYELTGERGFGKFVGQN